MWGIKNGRSIYLCPRLLLITSSRCPTVSVCHVKCWRDWSYTFAANPVVSVVHSQWPRVVIVWACFQVSEMSSHTLCYMYSLGESVEDARTASSRLSPVSKRKMDDTRDSSPASQCSQGRKDAEVKIIQATIPPTGAFGRALELW